MKQMIYVTDSIMRATAYIQANTDWVRISGVCFTNGDEKITIITNFNSIRGRKVDGIYIDDGYYNMNIHNRHEFKCRFALLGMTPIFVHEGNR